MSITDELRKYARGYEPTVNHKLLIIADHIDEEYERELREEHTKGYNDGFDEGFASADDWDVDHADTLREHGWVELPKDADGVPIHRGDVLDGYKTTITVGRMVLNENGWMLQNTAGAFWYDPAAFTHHVERPTVESLLRDFYVYAERGVEHHRVDVDNAVLADYADRIREVLRDE